MRPPKTGTLRIQSSPWIAWVAAFLRGLPADDFFKPFWLEAGVFIA